MENGNKKKSSRNGKEIVKQNKKYCHDLIETIKGLDFKSLCYIKLDLQLAQIEVDYQYSEARD
jgi:hypothetical protein